MDKNHAVGLLSCVMCTNSMFTIPPPYPLGFIFVVEHTHEYSYPGKVVTNNLLFFVGEVSCTTFPINTGNV